VRQHSKFSRAVALAACALVACAALPSREASAQGFFDFLFGGGPPKQQTRKGPSAPAPEANFFADPFGLNTPAAPPQPVQRNAGGGGSGPAFCVRTCDGKYFPLARSAVSSAQMCQSFCPATTTKVFLGSNIDNASTNAGERYADMDNAYAYRKALRADCTCNGRDPAGLAPVDLSLDTSLRPGDVIATNSGLVAYSGVRTGNGQTAEFTPVASYPGLTSEVRSRLGEMKVAPVAAEMINEDAPAAESSRDAAPATTVVPKANAAARGKRAELN
jgi:hypothetical protein